MHKSGITNVDYLASVYYEYPMIEHFAWGPDTSLAARETILHTLRKLRRVQDTAAVAALTGDDLALADLVDLLGGPEACAFPTGGRVVLSTCDRIEVWQGQGSASPAMVTHLLELAAGLRSPLLGENAILGQVREAYASAASAWAGRDPRMAMATPGWPPRECPDCRSAAGLPPLTPRTRSPGPVPALGLSPGLHRLFQTALACGKEVRTRTGLCQGAVGHAQAAFRIIRSRSRIAGARILLVGAHKITADLLAWLAAEGCTQLCLVNRDQEKARILAGTTGARICGFEDLAHEVAACDILVSATSAPHTVLRHGEVRPKSGALWLDLAMPRDIDPALSGNNGMVLLDISTVEALVQDSLAHRQNEVAKALAIVAEHRDKVLARWQAGSPSPKPRPAGVR